MANWAWGSVSVTGAKENVLKFVQKFRYQDEADAKITVPYFARSITQTTRSETLDEINALFEGVSAETESTYTMYVDFAWSAYSCLIDGTPQEFEECITLSDACVADEVCVEIKTEELGIGFEEEIFCNKGGDFSLQAHNLLDIACKNCGTINTFASFRNLVGVECFGCGEQFG